MTTGSEIWIQLSTAGVVPTAFVAGVGTGGTVIGAGRYLKSCNRTIRVHPLEPAESPTLSAGHKTGQHRIQGISDEFIPPIVKMDELDEVVAVPDGDAILMAQKLAHHGLAVGISSGANFLGAPKVQMMSGDDAPIVTVFPDSNKKYLSTDLLRREPIRPAYESPHVEILGFAAFSRSCSFAHADDGRASDCRIAWPTTFQIAECELTPARSPQPATGLPATGRGTSVAWSRHDFGRLEEVMTPFRTILVPIDFSPGSIAAARRAHALAAIFHSHVHLLHVVAPPDIPLAAVEPFWMELWARAKSTRVEALGRLATLVAEERFDPFTTTGLVRTGRAEQVISEYADEAKAELIVMGIHGDHAQPVGQVVERVLGQTHCAVLAIPPSTTGETSVERTQSALLPVAC